MARNNAPQERTQQEQSSLPPIVLTPEQSQVLIQAFYRRVAGSVERYHGEKNDVKEQTDRISRRLSAPFKRLMSTYRQAQTKHQNQFVRARKQHDSPRADHEKTKARLNELTVENDKTKKNMCRSLQGLITEIDEVLELAQRGKDSGTAVLMLRVRRCLA
jgi:soluble cytochrome b562